MTETPQPQLDTVLKAQAASQRCVELFHRVMLSRAIVSSALELRGVLGELEMKMRHHHASGVSGVKDLLTEHKIIVPIEEGKPFDVEEVMPLIAKGLAKQAAVNAEKVISAAVVILSHSIADDVFTEVCKLAIDLDPAKWIPLLELERKVTLRSVKEKGADGIFEEELQRLKSRMGGKSFPNRAKILFERVPIQMNPQILRTDPDYFKLSQLKEVDELRVKLVHSNGLPEIDPEAGNKFAGFLHEAASTAVRSLVVIYEIPQNRPHWLSLVTPPTIQGS